jgi:hypothetical protein
MTTNHALIEVRNELDELSYFRVLPEGEARLRSLDRYSQERDCEYLYILKVGGLHDMRAECATALREMVKHSYTDAFAVTNAEVGYDPTGCRYRDPDYGVIAEHWERVAQHLDSRGMSWEASVVRAANAANRSEWD